MGIYQVHSPREIVTNRNLYWDNHCKSGFGDFVQASFDRNITNRVGDMRTFDGIYLGPTGNRQVTVNVFDLNTGKVKNLT